MFQDVSHDVEGYVQDSYDHIADTQVGNKNISNSVEPFVFVNNMAHLETKVDRTVLVVSNRSAGGTLLYKTFWHIMNCSMIEVASGLQH